MYSDKQVEETGVSNHSNRRHGNTEEGCSEKPREEPTYSGVSNQGSSGENQYTDVTRQVSVTTSEISRLSIGHQGEGDSVTTANQCDSVTCTTNSNYKIATEKTEAVTKEDNSPQKYTIALEETKPLKEIKSTQKEPQTLNNEACVPPPQQKPQGWSESELLKAFEDYWSKFGETLVLQGWMEKYQEFVEPEDTDESIPLPAVREEEVITCNTQGKY